ncbi:MAG: cupredoxin family copper-binding protein [Candidatus Zixiibacteriota bacterium]
MPAEDNQATAGGNSVNIQNYAFSPSSITVSVGTTVTWTNMDAVIHTATSTGGPTSFDSGNLLQGQSWSYTFSQAGTYTYKCTPHPYMTGTVVVQ